MFRKLLLISLVKILRETHIFTNSQKKKLTKKILKKHHYTIFFTNQRKNGINLGFIHYKVEAKSQDYIFFLEQSQDYIYIW